MDDAAQSRTQQQVADERDLHIAVQNALEALGELRVAEAGILPVFEVGASPVDRTDHDGGQEEQISEHRHRLLRAERFPVSFDDEMQASEREIGKSERDTKAADRVGKLTPVLQLVDED